MSAESNNPRPPPPQTGEGRGVPGPRTYAPPAILWEQPFVALAQISPPPCDPDSDPNCRP